MPATATGVVGDGCCRAWLAFAGMRLCLLRRRSNELILRMRLSLNRVPFQELLSIVLLRFFASPRGVTSWTRFAAPPELMVDRCDGAKLYGRRLDPRLAREDSVTRGETKKFGSPPRDLDALHVSACFAMRDRSRSQWFTLPLVTGLGRHLTVGRLLIAIDRQTFTLRVWFWRQLSLAALSCVWRSRGGIVWGWRFRRPRLSTCRPRRSRWRSP